jgi:hypothetical protein
MLLGCGLVGISRIIRRCCGMWRYLIVRAEGRTALELERERNRATVKALQLLPDGCELLEYEREGRLRVIRRPARADGSAVAGPKLRGPGGEVER